jgi:hypothetical protein
MEFSYQDNYSEEKKKTHMKLIAANAVEGDKIHKMAVKKLIDTIEQENKNNYQREEIDEYIVKLSVEYQVLC